MSVQSLSNVQGAVVVQLTPDVGNVRAGVTVSQQGTVPGSSEAPAQTPKQATDPAELKKAVDSLNKTVASLNQSLQFSVDEDTKMDVVKVVDITSREVLRQIPSPEVLSIAKAIDKLQGMLIKDKA
jgi:flagellar protein FlaG